MSAPERRISLMFRASSDPTRMRILHLLAYGELRVGELARVLRRPQPTVSRHLAYLRRAHLVRCRRRSRNAFYSLTAPRYAFHRHLLRCLKSSLPQVPEVAADLTRLRRLPKR